MILQTMLQRLYASLARGPGLNARPHNSRQRLDFSELAALQGQSPETILRDLFGPPARSVEFPAKVPGFTRPEYPEKEWSEEQKSSSRALERQQRVLAKLRDITADATDYANDHGENALFLGFPLISLPSTGGARDGFQTKTLLAPVLLSPVNLRVRMGSRAGVTIETAGEGGELIIPNPALLAWIEQQTGEDTDALFNDDDGSDPWREIREVLALVARATGIDPASLAFGPDTPLRTIPRPGDLPATATVIPGAVLGLFPLSNPGLLRDTKWMIENESSLVNPVQSFLAPQTLTEDGGQPLPAAREWDHFAPASSNSANAANNSPAITSAEAGRFLVTQADPCQTEAVMLARHSAALVIHGPPGTGKSQTIANVIGDHLARGERVLFVCDKRTALDVVKYRLDGMGLGALCGVIHDPANDRKDLYLTLRERLEALPGQEALADPAAQLQRINQRLTLLQAELRDAFARLHAKTPEVASFHELTGRWLELRARLAVELPETEGLSIELIDTHRTDIEESLLRAVPARWTENPFRNRLGISLGDWLALDPRAVSASLQEIHARALAVDNTFDTPAASPETPPLPALNVRQPLAEQATERLALASELDALVRRGHARLAALGCTAATLTPLQTRLLELQAATPLNNASLDREITLALGGNMPALADVNLRIAALDTWTAITGGIQRMFAFSARKAANEALAPLGQTLTPAGVEKGRLFYQNLRVRWLWTGFYADTFGNSPAALQPDAELFSLRDGLSELFALHNRLQAPALEGFDPSVQSLLAQLTQHGGAWIARLRRSAQRAQAIDALQHSARASKLFNDTALAADTRAQIEGAPAAPLTAQQLAFENVLDDAIRLTDRLQTLPAPLQHAVGFAIDRQLSWETAEPALRASAISREIRTRLRTEPALARIDTQRIEAAFSELSERTAEKQQCVRAHVIHHWQSRWRSRLLSSTGTRLNAIGTSIRQRLFVRGQRALKLRQMIASGSATPDGDPLFDLCPVWMASPATVSQIFPRTALFDVIIFDEASQCRLEEALPVLLRGKRVVIAGDPKQLPPTRFFEQAVAESDDVGAETAEDVFLQQQSDAEDLLTAALNLEVQEAFLDVHYRSRNEALIGFSNDSFYSSRLQPIPGHPRNKALRAPIRLIRSTGLYENRGNVAEAKLAVGLVAELLENDEPPSIGIACFNLNQRDLILDALDERAAADAVFSERLGIAKKRRGRDSFEGLFVKNLENVQGDERDHMIICTTFGPDKDGKFRRNFGALSRAGGERRLNVLVTRARDAIHVITSIPRTEYLGDELSPGERPTGRHLLYGYLRYAEQLEHMYTEWQNDLETARRDAAPLCNIAPTAHPSRVAQAIGLALHRNQRIGSTVHWGNDGFCVDVALTHPEMPEDVTIGVLTDFNRYRKTPDPIAWELFRTLVLRGQGWKLHRIWTPGLFRDAEGQLATIKKEHDALLKSQRPIATENDAAPQPDALE